MSVAPRALNAAQRFYIGGRWVAPARQSQSLLPVINPATEAAIPSASITLGSAADVDHAVTAARSAIDGTWGRVGKEERLSLLQRLADIYKAGLGEMAATISAEMGAPMTLARQQQALAGLGELKGAARILESFEFEEALTQRRGGLPTDRIAHVPIGVCALITPWNWPMNQVALKVAPALAAGCSVILKPSEEAPLSSLLFAQMVHEAGFPPGAFNLVNGTGAGAGAALASHPGVDMVSFTGSTRAGVAVSKASADSVKRVSLELGGKGPNLVFPDAPGGLREAVRRGVAGCFLNTGQSCNAPTRMLLPREVYDEAAAYAAEAAAEYEVGDPSAEGSHLGPLINEAQFVKVQGLIAKGIDEGATPLVGGLGRPDGVSRGYFVRPTVFGGATNQMTISRDEIFGPVLSLIAFGSEDDAVAIANDTEYGLTSYIQTGDTERARRLARRLHAGMVEINEARRGRGMPFGGVGQSGTGREGGIWGMHEYLEVKSISGWPLTD